MKELLKDSSDMLSDQLNRVSAELAALGVRADRDVHLSKLTYLRTGGKCSALFTPNSVEQLSQVVKLLHTNNLSYKVIGSTSNLLFLDDAEYTCLVRTTAIDAIWLDHENEQIVAEAGAMLPELSRFALYNELDGFSCLEGIPGTLGGAVFMNAGAYGSEIKDTLTAVDAITPAGDIVRFASSELGLRHRSSDIRSGSFKNIICRCYFGAVPGDAEKISHDMELYHAKRHKYQDYLYPNLGSIFSGSPYRALGSRDVVFKVISAAYYAINYEWRLFRRESPLNRKWLNDVLLRRFALSYDRQPFSDKTINCLVNRGQGTGEMVRFIHEMAVLTQGRIPLENEIVDGF